MKEVMKQLGKAICYVLLFVGMQVIVSFGFQFIYGFMAGIEAGMQGKTIDNLALVEDMTAFLFEQATLIAMISGILTIFVLWIVFAIRKKKWSHEVVFHKFDGKKVIPVILLGIATAFFVCCVLELLPIPESMMEAYMESASLITDGNKVITLLSTILVAPIVEEVIFRGLVISRLKRAMNVWGAIILSSLLFGLVHGQLLWTIYTFLLGILLAVVAEKCNSVAASILLHMSFNAIGVFGDLIILSGGQMIIVTVIALLVMICMLYMIQKSKLEKQQVCYQ